MESIPFKPLAFHLVNPFPSKKLEEVIEETLSANDNSHSYSDDDFRLGDLSLSLIRQKSGLKLLKINLLLTYIQIKKDFTFNKPKRNLTSPEEGVSNNGRDNIDSNLIVSVEDEICSTKHKYKVIDLIGQGVSGQVFEVSDMNDNDNRFALKVIKNKKAYKNQALIELKILNTLNTIVDKNDIYHIIRVHDYFIYHEHLCIVFELLNENLYQLLQHNHLQGISLNSIRFITKQILEATEKIHKGNIIHCDLKPENILLKIDKENKSCKGDISIKITDFGSACDKSNPMFTYIQSRYYRAPEVVLGSSYSFEIDIWSIGLIAAELFIGNPLIPGTCEYDQIVKIEALFGEVPHHLLKGRNVKKYYKINQEQRKIVLKSSAEYYNEYPNDFKEKYEIPYEIQSLDDLINIKRETKGRRNSHNPNRSSYHNTSNSSFANNDDLCSFIHFLKGLLNVDPKCRWTAKQCLSHPFITKDKLDTFISMCQDESQMMLSNERTYCHMNNSYNSMTYHVSPNNSMSFEMGNTRNFNCNTSNNNCYQPNLNNIHMNWMRNFPFAKVDQCDLKGNNRNNYNINMNRTFMMTSFDQINPNNISGSDIAMNNSHHNLLNNNLPDNNNNNYLNKKPKEKSKFSYPNIVNQNNINSNYDQNNFTRKEKRGKTIENPPFMNSNWFNSNGSPFVSNNNNEDNQAFSRGNNGVNPIQNQNRNTTTNYSMGLKLGINQSFDTEAYIRHLNRNSQINEEDNQVEEDNNNNKLIFQ